MKTTRVILVFLLLLSILISGCNSSQPDSNGISERIVIA